MRVFVQVGNLASAREAIEQGADVIVAQGGDAGGHQWAHGASVVVLVPEVSNLVSQMEKGEEVTVVAAGGVVDGRAVVASLGLGKNLFRPCAGRRTDLEVLPFLRADVKVKGSFFFDAETDIALPSVYIGADGVAMGTRVCLIPLFISLYVDYG